MKLEYIIFISTFTVFTLEALLHFMIGKHKIVLPQTKEAIQIITVVVVFSLINAIVSKYLHYLEQKYK
tara:strand:- start:931 stop:1134 length:204 start_codon:yes stop_codon:yes gene_type:complete